MKEDAAGKPLVLKFILIGSNVFSGLLAILILIMLMFQGLIPPYITWYNFTLTLISAFVVLLSSVGVFRDYKRHTTFFMVSWIVYLAFYLYNRYLAVLNGIITVNNATGKFLLAISWFSFLLWYMVRLKRSAE